MLGFLLLAALQSPDTVRYEVAFPNAAHHEAAITITFPVHNPDTLEVWMSRSSPGRYAVHEFAKNVYGVSAQDGRGRSLPVQRRDPYRWFVTGHDGTVRFTYTLFADRAGGTYTGIDLTHAHLNMPATFAWARGLERLPIAIRFTVPEGSDWRAATQLIPTASPGGFVAPDLQYFMDSPTELSDFVLRTWTVPAAAGGTATMRLAVHHAGTDAEVDAYTDMARQVVAEQIAIYGEPAPYDHGTYTFIADYLPWVSGDGMEHRNSTIIASTGSLAENSNALLGTLSHEFFHSWNIERIRPAMIEPFDFTRANPSDALWFGEGFTSYYDDLAIRRAGLTDDATYARGIGGLVNAVGSAPGRRYFTPMEMSMQAAFVDAATAIDPNNRTNTFLSYYTWGAGIGLGLDLSIRTRFPGKSLDGFMRVMWEQFGRNDRPYTIKRPYTVDDLERTLGSYTGDQAFARGFFAQYIRGHDVPDYATLLHAAGFLLRPSNVGAPFFGLVDLDYGSDGASVVNGTQVGSPLYDGGVDRGDVIRSIGGRAVRSDDDWQAIMAAAPPGGTVEIVFEQRGVERTAQMRVAMDERTEVVLLESRGTALTAAQRAFRADWLGSRAAR